MTLAQPRALSPRSRACTVAAMVDSSVDPPPPRRVDVNSLYSPAAAATEVEPQTASEEAALGRSGANALLAVTILEALGTTVVFLFVAPGDPDLFTLVFAYGIVVLFAGLYVWARSSPYPACIAGLALYITIHLLAALADPQSLIQGILVKVIVIGLLVRSIGNIRRHRAAQA